MKRKKPSFNEDYYGYRTFSELLEDAQKEGLIEIEKHRNSGMYVVSRFGLEMQGGSNGPPKPAPIERKEQRPQGRESGRTQPPSDRNRRPPAPQPAPIPAEEAPPMIDRRPMGRELVDDLEEDLDLVPSYGPKSSAPAKPVKSPPPPPSRRQNPPKEAAPAGGEPKRGRSQQQRGGRGNTGGHRRKPAEKPGDEASSPRPSPRPAAEEDDFGAGLV
jgi:hypothetical protein